MWYKVFSSWQCSDKLLLGGSSWNLGGSIPHPQQMTLCSYMYVTAALYSYVTLYNAPKLRFVHLTFGQVVLSFNASSDAYLKKLPVTCSVQSTVFHSMCTYSTLHNLCTCFIHSSSLKSLVIKVTVQQQLNRPVCSHKL